MFSLFKTFAFNSVVTSSWGYSLSFCKSFPDFWPQCHYAARSFTDAPQHQRCLEVMLSNSPAQTGHIDLVAHNKNGHIAPKSTAVALHYGINGTLV